MEGNKIQTIDEYIAAFPADVQVKLNKVRQTIQAAAPDAVEAIKYAIPTYVLGKNLVHFAGYKKHIGFYPTPAGIEAFQTQLAAYKQSKGAVQFPFDQPIPYDLIGEITRYRVKQVKGE